MFGPLLDVQMLFRVAGARDCAPSQTWGFCSISTNDGRRGTFEEDLQRCIFRDRCSTRDMFIRAVRKSGRWFPERGCILEHQNLPPDTQVQLQWIAKKQTCPASWVLTWSVAKEVPIWITQHSTPPVQHTHMPDSLPLAEFEKYAFPIFNEAYGISSIPQGAIHINLHIYICLYKCAQDKYVNSSSN